jgi:hypothetical protein
MIDKPVPLEVEEDDGFARSVIHRKVADYKKPAARLGQWS